MREVSLCMIMIKIFIIINSYALLIVGYRNMVNYGLLSENVEHVSTYDAGAVPLVYAEYDIAVRYFHTFLDGRLK